MHFIRKNIFDDINLAVVSKPTIIYFHIFRDLFCLQYWILYAGKISHIHSLKG